MCVDMISECMLMALYFFLDLFACSEIKLTSGLYFRVPKIE